MHVSYLMRLCCTGNQDLSGLEYQLGQLQLHAAQPKLGGDRCHFIWPCSCLQCRCRSYTTCKYVAIDMYVPAVATKYNCSSPNSGLIRMKARYSNQSQHHAPSSSSSSSSRQLQPYFPYGYYGAVALPTQRPQNG